MVRASRSDDAHGTSTRFRWAIVIDAATGLPWCRTTCRRADGPQAFSTAAKNRVGYTGVPRSRMLTLKTA